MSTATRAYRMHARAAAVEEATERILDAAEQLFWENPARPVALTAVAERAGVSVHSVIRRFGGRQGVIEAAVERSAQRAHAQRHDADPGDLEAIVRALLDHYEQLGERVLAMLAAEQALPTVRPIADVGRRLHVQWCERMFAGALGARRGADRRRLLAQLVAVCDVYTWMLLRRQRRLSRSETQRALVEMLEPLVSGRSRK